MNVQIRGNNLSKGKGKGESLNRNRVRINVKRGNNKKMNNGQIDIKKPIIKSVNIRTVAVMAMVMER
jgi:hypothetical protein